MSSLLGIIATALNAVGAGPADETIIPGSAAIMSMSYDIDNKEMQLIFNSGSIYTYYNVSRQRWKAFSESSSKGRYFNNRVKPTYVYTRG